MVLKLSLCLFKGVPANLPCCRHQWLGSSTLQNAMLPDSSVYAKFYNDIAWNWIIVSRACCCVCGRVRVNWYRGEMQTILTLFIYHHSFSHVLYTNQTIQPALDNHMLHTFTFTHTSYRNPTLCLTINESSFTLKLPKPKKTTESIHIYTQI